MNMNWIRTVVLGSMLGVAALSAPVFAADGDGMQTFQAEVKKMANKDGMVTKKEFMAMMEKKFDAMDKQKKGMLSADDIMKIFMDKGRSTRRLSGRRRTARIVAGAVRPCDARARYDRVRPLRLRRA
jgi:hypothetical protein